MLAKGYLAGTAVYVCTEHTAAVVDGYFARARARVCADPGMRGRPGCELAPQRPGVSRGLPAAELRRHSECRSFSAPTLQGRSGSGHVMRCLTLAESLRDGGAGSSIRGAAPRRATSTSCCASRGFEVADLSELPSPPAQEQRPPPARVAGSTRARRCRRLAPRSRSSGRNPTWLVVDHYGLDERWETELRDTAAQFWSSMISRTAATTATCCSIRIWWTGMATRYAARYPSAAPVMLGPRYALLQPVYADLHHQVAPRTGPVRRICIYFGAADRYGLTLLALRAFLGLGRRDIRGRRGCRRRCGRRSRPPRLRSGPRQRAGPRAAADAGPPAGGR